MHVKKNSLLEFVIHNCLKKLIKKEKQKKKNISSSCSELPTNI